MQKYRSCEIKVVKISAKKLMNEKFDCVVNAFYSFFRKFKLPYVTFIWRIHWRRSVTAPYFWEFFGISSYGVHSFHFRCMNINSHIVFKIFWCASNAIQLEFSKITLVKVSPIMTMVVMLVINKEYFTRRMYSYVCVSFNGKFLIFWYWWEKLTLAQAIVNNCSWLRSSKLINFLPGPCFFTCLL